VLASAEFIAAEDAVAADLLKQVQEELLARLHVRKLLEPKEGEPPRRDKRVMMTHALFVPRI
jgi:hypothetical protein